MAIGPLCRTEEAFIEISMAKRIRINAKIRVEKYTTSVVPFLKKFESNCIRRIHKMRIRGGSSNSPLPHLPPRDRRHHRSEEQQGNRRQPCEVGLLHSVVKDFLRNGSSTMAKSHSSHLTTFQVFMMFPWY